MMTTTKEKKDLTETELDLRLDKMKRLPRGSFKAKPNATKLENCKVKISLYIDADVLEYFRNRAELPNAAPYQAQINNELRQIVEDNSKENKHFEIDVLNNKIFLQALNEKLATV